MASTCREPFFWLRMDEVQMFDTADAIHAKRGPKKKMLFLSI